MSARRADASPHPAVEELGKVMRGHIPCQGHPVTRAEPHCTQQAANGRSPDGLGSSPSSATYWVTLGKPLICPDASAESWVCNIPTSSDYFRDLMIDHLGTQVLGAQCTLIILIPHCVILGKSEHLIPQHPCVLDGGQQKQPPHRLAMRNKEVGHFSI